MIPTCIQRAVTELFCFGVAALACLPAGCATSAVNEARKAAPVAEVDARVALSARFVVIRGALPAPEGALGFLSDEAGLRAGKVVLTNGDAEAALKALTRLTGAELRTPPIITVEDGQSAGFHSNEAVSRAERLSAVKIVAGGVEQEFTPRGVGASLKINPRVHAAGKVHLEIEVQTTSFDGFVEYGGDQVPIGDEGADSVKVPLRFYQPIFSTTSEPVEVNMAPGEVGVLRTQRMVAANPFARVADVVGKDDAITTETTVIFVAAVVEPLNR